MNFFHFLSDLNDIKNYGNIKISFTLSLLSPEAKEQHKRNNKTWQTLRLHCQEELNQYNTSCCPKGFKVPTPCATTRQPPIVPRVLMGQYSVLPQDNPPSSIASFSAAPRMPHSQRQPSVIPLAKLRLHLFASAAPSPYSPNGNSWIEE
jgi:hypothetical protein